MNENDTYDPIEKYISEPLRDLPRDEADYFIELELRNRDMKAKIEELEGALAAAKVAQKTIEDALRRPGEFVYEGTQGERIWEPPVHSEEAREQGKEEGFLDRQKTAADASAKKQREKSKRAKQALRKIWLSGKYSTKESCAIEEATALSVSVSTAKKLLHGVPNPPDDAWPAKKLRYKR